MAIPPHFSHSPGGGFCGRTRREFLWQAGAGFTGVALAGLLGREWIGGQALAADGTEPNPVAGLPVRHHAAKAKSVIFLFMYGGPSQVDSFDYKPKLYALDGQTVPVQTFGRGGKKNVGRVVGPKWKFKQYGQSGRPVSDLFPHLAGCVDDMAFLHAMYAESPIHGSALLNMNCGRLLSGHPSLGSWVNYGLGSVNSNLPGFVVMLDEKGGPISGAKNWTSGYMPASLQGVTLRGGATPILDVRPQAGMDDATQRAMLDFLNAENIRQAGVLPAQRDLAARVDTMELAYRMQREAPDAVDLSGETEETKALYGMDHPQTADFGRKCLLARRLVERGVRFIQVYSGGGHNDDCWDAHGDLVANHTYHAGRTDKAIAGLIQDLKRRGMLDETLIVWGGEFGRQPTAEYAAGTGRDHNSYGFTMWLAGGGTKGGVAVGATDELGSQGIENRFHVKNLHATILHLMGLDPNALSYFHNGLDQKLVGVEEVEPIRQIMA